MKADLSLARKHPGHPPRAGLVLVMSVLTASLLVQSAPALGAGAQWTRGAREWHTLLTCHLAHWSWDQWLWDASAFATLSIVCLRLAPARFAMALALAAVCIPLEIALFRPELASYRGLSGLGSALFGLACSMLALGEDEPGRRRLGWAGSLLFLGKCGAEAAGGQALFADSASAGFITATSAHLTGFLSGVTAALLPHTRTCSSECARAAASSTNTCPAALSLPAHNAPKTTSGKSGSGSGRTPFGHRRAGAPSVSPTP